MAIPFPSEEWITEWRHRLNDNEEYAEAGQGWGVGFDGDFVFHVRADDRLPEDAYFFIGLEDGRCTEATRSHVHVREDVILGREMGFRSDGFEGRTPPSSVQKRQRTGVDGVSQ